MREYKILQKNDGELLANEVNGYLKVGWDLYGPPNIASAGTHGMYCQAMIREVNSNERKPSVPSVPSE